MKSKKSVPAIENNVMDEYRIKDAAECLMRAEEIKKDEKLMPHVHKLLDKKAGAISSLKGLKELAQKKLSKAPEVKDASDDEKKSYKKKMGIKA
jgi:hypothetical protein